MGTNLQVLRRTKSQKTLYMSSRTTSRLIRSIIWTTNFPSPSCVSSNPFWERRLLPCVMKVSLVPPVCRADISIAVSGDHTRTIQIATPTVGGLMKFAVKTRTCLGCKTALKPTNSVPGKEVHVGLQLGQSADTGSDGAVCHNCRRRLPELYHKQIKSAAELQTRFARLWTQCQRCQGSLHQVGVSRCNSQMLHCSRY